MIERLAIGLIVSILASFAGWRANSLSGTGAVAATAVGTAIIVGASWPGAVVLGVLFVSSSALSRGHDTHRIGEKGGRRDAAQVLANGGIAACGALAGIAGHEQLALSLVAASLAAAAADTWATEIGSTSKSAPRMLVSGRQVVAGESGGVTARGTLAACAGALVIGIVAAIAGGIQFDPTTGATIGLLATIGGVLGAMVDSLAGELIQEWRSCPHCQQGTEARVHHCGIETVRTGGVPGINNDVVNGLCTFSGACIGFLIVLV